VELLMFAIATPNCPNQRITGNPATITPRADSTVAIPVTAPFGAKEI
jgi:hypothetical protein